MLENLIFVIMVVIAVAAGIWVWWLENHGSKPEHKSAERKDKW